MSNKYLFALLLLSIVLSSFNYANSLHNPNENATIDETQSIQDENFDRKENQADLTSEIFETIYNAYRIRSKQELEWLLNISDYTFLTFFYKESNKKSIQVAQTVKKLSLELEHLAGFVLVDCDNFETEDYPMCQSSEYTESDGFPKLQLLAPPVIRLNKQTSSIDIHHEIPWNGKPMTYKNIREFLVNNINDNSIKLDSNNIYDFLHHDMFNKVIYFTDGTRSDLTIRGIQAYFQDKVLFGTVDNTKNPELSEKFKITKFPSLIIYKTNDESRLMEENETLRYQGYYKFANLKEFIEPHGIKEKAYITLGRGISLEDNIMELAQKINIRKVNAQNFDAYLEKYKDKNILIYYHNSDEVKDFVKHFMIQTK